MYLRVENIYKTYPNGFSALKGVSFQVQKSELVALLGLSGSGKTTLLRIIAGLEYAQKGSIYIENSNIEKVPVQNRNFGFVFQDYALFPHLNVSENISFGLKLRKFKKEVIKKKVEELLELIEIPHLAKSEVGNLSGGQKQRVAMARALAIEPRILLLDEPFSALDVKVRKSLRVATKSLQKKLNITTILVTHDINEAFEMADKIAIVHKGKIEQFGSKEELFQKPKNDFVRQFIGIDSFEI